MNTIYHFITMQYSASKPLVLQLLYCDWLLKSNRKRLSSVAVIGMTKQKGDFKFLSDGTSFLWEAIVSKIPVN